MCVGVGLVQRLIVSGVCRMFVGGRGSALFGTMVGGAINSSFDLGELHWTRDSHAEQEGRQTI